MVGINFTYCHPGRGANVTTPCLLIPCLNLPNILCIAWDKSHIGKRGSLIIHVPKAAMDRERGFEKGL